MGIFTTLKGEQKAAFFRKQYRAGKYSLGVLEEHGISPEEPEKPLPSLVVRAKNVTKAAGRVVKATCKGEKVKAPPELVAARQSACNVCPEKNRKGVCMSCGCTLSAKQWLLTESCPLGKWPSVASAD